jgi:fructuronate reductase
MTRLNPDLLPNLQIPQPQYDRSQLKPGIVHLGIGAFHRAHQAVYTEAVMNNQGGDWGIIGCSLRSDSVKRQLEAQQGLYTVLERGSSNRPQIIGAVQQVLVGPENPAAIIAAMAVPSVKIISLTITEKGYCHHPATGALNYEHPDIQHDLGHPFSPVSAPGFLVAGLRERFRQQLPPVSILSCDNLPDNGAVTRTVVTALAELVDSELAYWIKEKVSFPGTMVDRIVPATTQDDISWLENQYGYEDQGLVVAEPFSQWVIEDNFCNDRPAWESVGALLVNDVAHYETMKLRLLNGSHSLLAYSGYLAGYATIYQVVQDPNFVELTRRFMALTGTTFSPPQNFDLAGYQEQLRERFANPGLQHKTWQIAMDGSQKIPQRWLNSLRELIARKEDAQIFAFALAGWMRFIGGTDENGDAIVVSDPMAATLMEISRRDEGDFAQQVREYFALERIFGTDLKNNADLWQQTAHWLERIHARGVKGALEELLTVTTPHD